jgi:poly(3-hydroxybutyrate) depolymerase
LRRVALVPLWVAMAASPAAWARQETGFLDRSIVFDGVEYRYAIHVPRNWSPERRWPVILALHGGGNYGNDGLSPTEGGLGKAIRIQPDRYPAIVVFPHGHTAFVLVEKLAPYCVRSGRLSGLALVLAGTWVLASA